MNCPPDVHERQIVRSWNVNADPWVKAVRGGHITSRRQVTDRAIIDAVSSLRPRRVLDVGCGEGWLTRTLAAAGIEVMGIDVVPALIAEAVRLGGGEFQVQDYESIALGHWHPQRAPPEQPGYERSGPEGQGMSDKRCFDTAVCNFSLLGGESVESLLSGLKAYLRDHGRLVIQTLHPVAACGEGVYEDGWRSGSWRGFGEEFRDPAPWYFRTVESWRALLGRSGFEVLECREPTAAEASAPSSIIFIGKVRAAE